MRRLLAIAAALGLLVSACATTSDRVTAAVEVPSSLVAGEDDVGTGSCTFVVGGGIGATVVDVLAGGPADGTLLAGDVITSFGARTISTSTDVVAAVQSLPPNEPVAVGIERDGAAMTIEVTLGENADSPGRALLGVLVTTAETRVDPTTITSNDVTGPLSRVVSIDGTLWQLDPTGIGWSPLGADDPSSGWVPIDGEVWWIDRSVEEFGTITGQLGGSHALAQTSGWTPQIVLTSLDGDVVVAAERPDGAGGFETAVIALDPLTGIARWAWLPDASSEAYAPSFAFKDPDDERILLALTPPGDLSVTRYVMLSLADDTPVTTTPMGIPSGAIVIGWADPDHLMAITTSISDIAIVDPDSGEAAESTLPITDIPTGMWPVGDGSHVLVETGSNLLLVEIGGSGRRNITNACGDTIIGEFGF